MNIVNNGQIREWVGSGGRSIMVETEPIRISLEHKAFLKSLGTKDESYDSIIEKVIAGYKISTMKMKEAQVDEWGKVMISRTMKGKPILWIPKE